MAQSAMVKLAPAAQGRLGELRVEDAERGVERSPRVSDAVGVAPALRPQLVADDLLHRRREVMVGDAVPQAGLERRGSVGGNQRGPGEPVEVLDDRRRLGQREVGVLVAQHGDAGERPQAGELSAALGALDELRAERQVELVERDQHLLAVRGERVLVEDEGHGGSRVEGRSDETMRRAGTHRRPAARNRDAS